MEQASACLPPKHIIQINNISQDKMVKGYFSSLSLYDILGNFAPGAALLLFLSSIPANGWFPDSTGAYALFLAVSLLIGHFIQYHASTAVEDWQIFDKLMNFSRDLGSEDEDDGRELSSQSSSTRYASRAFLLPISCCLSAHKNDGVVPYRRLDTAEGLSLENIVNEAWSQLYFNKFDNALQRGDQRFDQMLNLMSSTLESAPYKPRSLRFQAIRNLQRGMWITSWYSSVILVSLVIFDLIVPAGQSIPLTGIKYSTPYLFQLPVPNHLLLVLSLASVFGFWHLFNRYDELFTRYVFTDYLVEIELEDKFEGEIESADADKS